MSIVNKEAQVCKYLDKYLKNKVKELLEECDHNWLINEEKTIKVCQNTTTEDGRSVIIYPQTPIEDILHKQNTIFYAPKNVAQTNVSDYIKSINKECKRIRKKYIEYEYLVDSNIRMLELLLDE